MRIQNRKSESENKKEPGEPAGEFGEDIRRLRAKKIFRYTTPERGAQALAFWTLHQNDEGHEERDEGVNPEKKIDQNGHWGRGISPKSAVCKRFVIVNVVEDLSNVRAAPPN